MSSKITFLLFPLLLFTLLQASCQSKEDKEKYQAALQESLNSIRISANRLDSQLSRQIDLSSVLLNVIKTNFPNKQADKEFLSLKRLRDEYNVAKKAILPESYKNQSVDLSRIDKYISDASTTLNKALVNLEKDPSTARDQNASDLAAQLKGTNNRIETARADLQTTIDNHNKTFPKDKM